MFKKNTRKLTKKKVYIKKIIRQMDKRETNSDHEMENR